METNQKSKEQGCSNPQGSCDSCGETGCSVKQKKQTVTPEKNAEEAMLDGRMLQIKNKIVVLSGKGGVGKSTVAVNLAMSLIENGKKVGLLDIDIHGPSIPTMLGIKEAKVGQGLNGIAPVEIGNLKVMSIGFLLKNEDDPLIWRGPMKIGVIKQFLSEFEWGELDYLVIDSPPGTGDEPLSICQLIQDISGAVIVTTPQEVAAADVRKSINFCSQVGLEVLGIVENMSGFKCPDCGKVTNIFHKGGGEKMAQDYSIPFLGKLPIDPSIGAAADMGRGFLKHYGDQGTGEVFNGIAKTIMKKCK